MADQLPQIVKVTITRQTKVPSMKSFSEHLVVAEFNPVGIEPVFDPLHRVRLFGSLDEIVAAGFPADSYVYRAALAQYAQSPHIGNLYVGIKYPAGVYDIGVSFTGDFVTGNILKVENSQGATVVEVDFDSFPSPGEMIDELIKQFNMQSEVQKIIKVSDTEVRIFGAFIPYEVTVTGGATQPTLTWKDNVSGISGAGQSDYIAYPEDATWTDALNRIKIDNNDWYAISVGVRSMIEQQEVAKWIQANEKLGILTSGDPLIYNETTGDIGAWAKLNNLDRVVIALHPDAKLPSPASKLNPADPIMEAAYFGKMLTKQPGSATWKFKELQGVPTYVLTQGQVNTVEGKNVTWYMSTADVPITSDGKTASGEYIDIIHGLDWLKALIETYVFIPFVQNDKVSYTDVGIEMIASQLRKALAQGVTNKLLASFTVSVPKAYQVSTLMKGQRTLPDLTFTGVLAGAIHRTIIEGVVTLKRGFSWEWRERSLPTIPKK
ncbi:hypothetical protein FACS1894172_14850 [Spirochaetia bacterium]|nr:hypothetical protein FACS1894172_14850 [Spirochaetia bacterium]